VNNISIEKWQYASNSPKKWLIEGVNCAGSVANTNALLHVGFHCA